DDQEDDPREDEDEDVRLFDLVRVRRVRRRREEAAVPRRGNAGDEKRADDCHKNDKGSPAHAGWHRINGESRPRGGLPPHVRPPYEVFVNGVPQVEGTDYELVGTTLLFRRVLAREGKLGFWRWLSMLLGVAGTYRKNEAVTVVYNHDGRRMVANLQTREDTV